VGRTPYSRCPKKGEFDDLPGSGEPLVLDDDSHIAPELRAGYRLLKNAGCLLLNLNSAEAVELVDLLKGSARTIHDILNLAAVALLELKLRQAG
jgi:hypothetical protein